MDIIDHFWSSALFLIINFIITNLLQFRFAIRIIATLTAECTIGSVYYDKVKIKMLTSKIF